MGKKILFIVRDDSSGYDSPRDWDNLWSLTTFEKGRRSDYITHHEGGFSSEGGPQALGVNFGFGNPHSRSAPYGGLVRTLSRGSEGGLWPFRRFIYDRTIAMQVARRVELGEESGDYLDSDSYVTIADDVGIGGGNLSECDGLLTLSFEKLKQNFADMTKEEAIERAFQSGKDEMETYSAWAEGEVYAGTVIDAETGEELDSGGGYYGGDHKKSGLLDNFDYDEVANRGGAFDDNYEMRDAIRALTKRDEDEDEDEDEDY
jgi:hypothetical protein